MTVRLGTFVVLAALLVGCTPPRQYGGPIRVQPGGAAGRLHLLCRFGLRVGADSELCAPPPSKTQRTAKAELLTEPADEAPPAVAPHEGARRVAHATGEPITDDAVVEPRSGDPLAPAARSASPEPPLPPTKP